MINNSIACVKQSSGSQESEFGGDARRTWVNLFPGESETSLSYPPLTSQPPLNRQSSGECWELEKVWARLWEEKLKDRTKKYGLQKKTWQEWDFYLDIVTTMRV